MAQKRKAEGEATRDGPTGITSLDVHELLAPFTRCLLDMQQQIIEDNLDMMDTLQKDPVPQFTIAEIKTATAFLSDATTAMQTFLEDFEPAAVRRLKTSNLVQHLDRARESARRLVLLFGEQKNAFNGSKLEGSLLRFSESTQSQEVQDRLKSLNSFLSTFSQAAWLGAVLQACDFQQKIGLVTTLLNGLLNPSRPSCASPLDELQKVEQSMNMAGCGMAEKQRVQRLRSRAASHPYLKTFEKPYESACHDGDFDEDPFDDFEKDPFEKEQYESARSPSFAPPRSPAATTAAAPVPNPLESVEKMFPTSQSRGWEDRLQCLNQMCLVFTSVHRGDREMRRQLQEQQDAKMESLKKLASTLNSVPGVLNRYLLVRLSDVDSKDLGQQAWITQDEATQVHKMLEAFRDEAIYERAVRDMSARRRAPPSPLE